MNLEVESVSKEEVMENMQRMKNGKAVGPDDIPVEVWKCLGESALKFLTKLYNRTMESERMPEEWRDSVLIPIFKNKGDVQRCSNYTGIKLISHTMKLWERIVEKRLRSDLKFSNQQYGFMPGKSTTDALFALRVFMEKYREGQKELHCVFVDLEKAYDKVPREEVWYCMRKSGLAEKYVRIVQNMYAGSTTAVRCAVGVTEGFEVKVGLHQGSALSPCLFAMMMDRMTVKGKVYKVAMRPAMLYGLETVALTKRQETEMEVAELKMLRFSLGVTRMDKIRNEYIRGTAQVGKFGEKTREARLRWFGHLRRKDDGYIGRRMLRMELPGKRKRGRPKRRFVDVVKEDMAEVEVTEEDTVDRNNEKENPLWRPLMGKSRKKKKKKKKKLGIMKRDNTFSREM